MVADESTVTGFLLTGFGQRGKDNQSSNYIIVSKETTDSQLEEDFAKLIKRNDIGVVLIS